MEGLEFNKPTSLQEALDFNGETLEQFNHRTQFDTDGQKAGKELEVIALAINKGKVLTYKDTSYRKYFPVFWSVGSSRGFAYNSYDYNAANSLVGARLTVVSAEAAKFFGTQHLSIWDRYINGQ